MAGSRDRQFPAIRVGRRTRDAVADENRLGELPVVFIGPDLTRNELRLLTRANIVLEKSECPRIPVLIQKELFEQCPVSQGFMIITASMVVSGLSPLLVRRGRAAFQANWPKIRPALRFLVAIEVANLIALATSQYAVHFGSPSLVSAVEATMPGYCFAVSIVLWGLFRKYGEQEAKDRLPLKITLVGLMAFGVWLVS